MERHKCQQVIDFLHELEFPEQNPWPITQITDYIQHRVEHTETELSSWNLALIGLEGGTRQQPLVDFGNQIELVLPRRTRKVNRDSLGWVAGSTDTVVDLPGEPSDYQGQDGRFSYNQMWLARDPSNPLILAYIFDRIPPSEAIKEDKQQALERTYSEREKSQSMFWA